MTLVITWLGISAAAFGGFWGLSLFLQRYFYNEPAENLVLRAAVAGVLLGTYLTFWVYINTRAEGENKYGVIHEFSPNAVSDPVDKFQAVRIYPNANPTKEETVSFERQPTPDGQRYLSAERKVFTAATTDYLTTALILDLDGKPTRFEAAIENTVYLGEKITFSEQGGGRTILLSRGLNSDPAEPVTVTSPSGGVVFLAILLNVLHFAVWFAALWPVLRFNFGHALGLAVVFGVAATVILMPLLFQANTVEKAPTLPTPAVQNP